MENSNKEKTLKLVETGILLALIIVIQVVTKPMGQILTGSLVNLCLALAALLCGPIYSGILAIVSPILAMFLGVGPKFYQLVLGIIAGNLIYVLILSLVLRTFKKNGMLLGGVIVAAALKFLAINIINVKIILPTIVADLTIPARTKVAFMFGFPQLITALVGGIIAYFVVRTIRKLREKKENISENEEDETSVKEEK